jgi:acyl-CoA synthetase (AMP-forming)/AMP-acid ligase II
MLMTSDDVVLIMVPLFHVTSLHSQIAPAVMRGAKSVLMGYFHPTEALQLIQHEKVTFLSGAPVMLWLMMVQPDFDAYDVSSLQKVGYGGSAASPQFVKMVAEKFPNASQINAGGMTEHTSLGFALPPEDALRKRGSVGLSLVTSEITLFDEEGYEILEPGKLGEIAFKGPLTSKGYWRDPEKTKETFRRDGYVLSGDIGKIDEEGYLWIADRKKDMISRGGQKCYGVELENVLFGLNKVLDVAIVGVPDRVFTERVKAVITPKPGEELTKAEVLAFCEQHLAKYEIPEYVVFKKDLLPKNPGGKTIKTLLIDDWGDLPDHAKDPAIERYKGFLSSLHPKLESVPLLFVGDREMTAGEGLSHMEHADAIGEKIRDIVQQEGIVALLR